MSYIPQELLMNVASFGLVPRRLEPEYIAQEMNSIDPNFPWSAEFLREYLRATHPLYNQFRRQFDALGDYAGTFLTSDIYRLEELDNLRDVATEDIYHPDTLVLMLHTQYASDIYDRIAERQSAEDIAYTGDHNLYLILIEDTTPVDIINALYLGRHVRDERDLGYMGSLGLDQQSFYYMSGRGEQLPENEDYPFMISTMDSNDKLIDVLAQHPQALELINSSGYIPTNTELVRAILKINPRYNLGRVLAWARRRQDIKNQLQRDPRLSWMYYFLTERGASMNDAVVDADFIVHQSVFYVDEVPEERLREYLNELGISPARAYISHGSLVITGLEEGDRIKYTQQIMNDFLRARAIDMYNPISN